jgi:hypothetical protein
MGVNDSTMTSGGLYSCDISYGDGTNQVILGSDKLYHIASSNEDLNSRLQPPFPCEVPAGATIYGRMQCSGTADAGLSMAAYGVY